MKHTVRGNTKRVCMLCESIGGGRPQTDLPLYASNLPVTSHKECALYERFLEAIHTGELGGSVYVCRIVRDWILTEGRVGHQPELV